MNFDEWSSLPEAKRIQYFDSISPYEPNDLAAEIRIKFNQWAVQHKGVSWSDMCNYHGSLELRIEWIESTIPSHAPRHFHGIYIRNVPKSNIIPTESILGQIWKAIESRGMK